ncbi:MAG TPA: winged helix DNA-binding domain-containing protein [Actinomycetota bacterium]|nr:winged helix DNA-binding domain-containing protein [Actinomycetota bacterium]
MKPIEIAQWRMHNLGLWSTHATRPADVVSRLGAMQAQDFPYAKWSLAQRLEGVGESKVDRAFDKGTFLRTHVLRPTWHFVPRRDIRWMLQLTAPRVIAMGAAANRHLELDDRVFARTNRIITKALEGGKHLTRRELVTALNRGKIMGTGQRFAHILLRAELEGLICSGPRKGKEHTYALLDERVGRGRVLAGEAALAELARRYFNTRGPATLRDFSWWASLKMSDCRAALALLGDELDSREVEDRTYWFARSSAPPKLRNGTIDLIQVYDECVVSYTLSRDALVAVDKIPREIMFFWHPMLLDGQLVGHWRRRTKGDLMWLEMFTYRKLRAGEKSSLDNAITRYQDFIGRPVDIEMTSDPRT